MWCWYDGHPECKSCGAEKAFTQISEDLRSGECTSDRTVHDALRVKAKVLWWPHKVEEDKNMDGLLSKASENERSHPKEKSMRPAPSNLTLVGPLEFMFYHKLSWMLDIELEILTFALLRFDIALFPLISAPLSLLFRKRMFTSWH